MITGTSEGTPFRVLWIDDEVCADDAAVVLLGLEGVNVDCAASGEGGLRLALSRSYAGVLLDLRLPDIDGLSLLPNLLAGPHPAPVMVLTGFGDVPASVTALKLGAADFREKPLIGEAFVLAVKKLCAEGPPAPFRARVDSRVAPRALTRMDLSVIDFLAMALAFRRVQTGELERPSLVGRASAPLSPAKAEIQKAEHAFEQLSGLAAQGLLMSADEFARILDLSRDEVRDLLERVVGMRFLKCRLALRIRPTLPLLAFTSEQTAQIAFATHYAWAAQFDRDFQIVLGLTPIAFRDACGGQQNSDSFQF